MIATVSESQRHGFEFEQIIRHAMAEARSVPDRSARDPLVDATQSYTAPFDIPAHHDPEGKSIPTCVKIAKRGRNGRVRVDMADARRALALGSQPLTRLVVGVFEQIGDHKKIDEVRQYVISAESWKSACGGVDPAAIAQFHSRLAEGTYQEARAFAKAKKAELASRHPSALQWSPKIDSKKQRRLQCSIYLDDLDKVATRPQDSLLIHRPGTDPLWGVYLPITIKSPPRVRHKKPDGRDPDR